MFRNICYALGLLATTHMAAAAPFAFDARSFGMGNIGVATADLASAAFSNPAMLAFQRQSDDFSLLIAGGLLVNDNEGLLDDIDEFESANDRFEAGDTSASTDMLAIAQKLNNKTISPDLSGAISVGFAGDTYSMALSLRTDISIAGGMVNVAQSTTDVVDPDFNILSIGGASVVDVGFSVARNFHVGGKKLSIGVAPRVLSVEAIEFHESINSSSTDLSDLTSDSVLSLGEFFTLDAGLVIGLTDNLQLGIYAKNLITDEVSYVSVKSGETISIQFDTQARAGIGYRTDYFVIGVDVDLIENESVFSSTIFSGLKTQILSVGAEINALDFLQLRFGAMKNIASDLSEAEEKAIYTLGLGIWLGFNLDVAAVAGEGETFGAYVQTGFRF